MFPIRRRRLRRRRRSWAWNDSPLEWEHIIEEFKRIIGFYYVLRLLCIIIWIFPRFGQGSSSIIISLHWKKEKGSLHKICWTFIFLPFVSLSVVLYWVPGPRQRHVCFMTFALGFGRVFYREIICLCRFEECLCFLPFWVSGFTYCCKKKSLSISNADGRMLPILRKAILLPSLMHELISAYVWTFCFSYLVCIFMYGASEQMFLVAPQLFAYCTLLLAAVKRFSIPFAAPR